MINFKGCWDDTLPLMEFTYNISYHPNIQMALYEALYGLGCGSPVCWFEVGEAVLIKPYLVHDAMKEVLYLYYILH